MKIIYQKKNSYLENLKNLLKLNHNKTNNSVTYQTTHNGTNFTRDMTEMAKSNISSHYAIMG